jgi:glycosyltransferase involved in cell wall biosynthesis
MKKIIGIDASRAAKQYKTGTEWYAYNLIEELKEIVPSEYEVRLYSPKPLEGELANLPSNWKNVVLSWRGYLWTTLRLSWEMFVNPPDVLWLPCSGLPIYLPKKTVNTIHDVGFDRFPEAYPKRRVLFHRFYVREALRRCSAILTVSKFSKREIIDLYQARASQITTTPLAANKVFRIYNRSEFEPILKKYEITQPYILFVGRIEHKKNIPRLLAAFEVLQKESPYLQFVLAGPRGDAETLIDSAVKYLPHNIKRLNWVTANELPMLFAGAEVFAFPTLYEGFGITILESMSCGTPVLTSRGGAHEEVSGEAALLVDPTSSESIARGLRKLVSDQELRVKLRKLGLERSEQFDWQKTAEITWTAISSQL